MRKLWKFRHTCDNCSKVNRNEIWKRKNEENRLIAQTTIASGASQRFQNPESPFIAKDEVLVPHKNRIESPSRARMQREGVWFILRKGLPKKRKTRRSKVIYIALATFDPLAFIPLRFFFRSELLKRTK